MEILFMAISIGFGVMFLIGLFTGTVSIPMYMDYGLEIHEAERGSGSFGCLYWIAMVVLFIITVVSGYYGFVQPIS